MATVQEIKDVSVKFAIAFEFERNTSKNNGAAKWKVNNGLPWNVNDPASRKFALDLDNSFNARTKTYTHLSPSASDKVSLAGRLEKIKNIASPNNSQYSKEMTEFVRNRLKNEFEKSQLASKFIVTVVLYETYIIKNQVKQNNTVKETLNISMIRASEALQFDSNYRITKIPAIDFSNLLQSSRIDVGIFTSNLKNKSKDPRSDMSFIAGKGDIRDYFFRGLGAQDFIKNSVAADNFLNGLNSFLLSVGLGRQEKNSIKDNVHSYLSNPKFKDGAMLEDVEKLLDSHIPDSLKKHKGTFISYLANNDYPVNEKIVFSTSQRDRLIWIDIEISDLKMRFRSEDVGPKNSNAKLKYDATSDTLSFEEKITDPDTRDAIKRALGK
ncbi:nucleoid-associated protein [Idiomarina xiamenensis]|uniref:Nucleoid-associated protein NdpA n=1 Tax=Idiomarina xiamenensis 10-D-4 TaxID=740709 RepID=K2JXR7_9GAMM|nr:nucleoid-associated protein [Idiomarina xiamenensis]EKE79452.1 hypothetical protein A10D4_12829 [Idiomarina xiamenensis 10-D-4]